METTKLNTVRLKDGSEYPLSASWNDLADKPFYTEVTETVLMPETELTFAYQKGGNLYQYTNNDVTDIADKWAGAWNKAIVVIDGVRYDTPKRSFNGQTFVGDMFRANLGVAVTGEPFVAVLTSNFVIGVFADTTPEDPDNVPDVTHTVSITLVNDTVKKLEDVYQHQPDWDNTDQNSAACIKNRPFGLMAEDGYVWAEKDVVYHTSDRGASIIGIDVAPLLCAGKILLEVDGTKYVSTEIHSGDGAPDGVIDVLFADADGNSAYVGSAGTEEATGNAGIFAFYPSDESSLTDGQNIHVKVTVFGSRTQIDKDYLPILDKKSEAVLDSLVKFSYDTELGNWVSGAQAITEEQFQRIVNAEPNVTVVLDSAAGDIRESSRTGNSLYLYGNAPLFGSTSDVYGNICAVKFEKTTTDGVTNYSATIRIAGDAPTDTSTPQTHYINLRFQGDKDSYTIKREYIPDPPEFDLTAMGLAAIPADGTSVRVDCDTTELRSALDNGNVKLTFSHKAESDAGTQGSLIGTAAKLTGSYQLSSVVFISSTPMLFNFVVTDTAISAKIITLAVPAAQ